MSSIVVGADRKTNRQNGSSLVEAEADDHANAPAGDFRGVAAQRAAWAAWQSYGENRNQRATKELP